MKGKRFKWVIAGTIATCASVAAALALVKFSKGGIDIQIANRKTHN